MSPAEPLRQIEDALRNLRLDVESVEDTFNVQQGTGIMAHRAHLDPRPLLAALSDDPHRRRRQIAGFANGVKHVLLEPVRSSADEWDFVESAGRLVPSLQVSTFAEGVRQAADDSPWTVPFVDDLVFAYFIQLDRGLRALTTSQVERWGVSDDRITSAGRSLLFHKTRNLDFEPFKSYAGVERLHAGDDLDAARCLVVADVFYSDLGPDFCFAIPSTSHFLAVQRATSDNRARLQRAADEVYQDAHIPLSTRLFRFDTGKPIPLENEAHD